MAFTPLVPPGMFFHLALIFGIIAVFSFGWLVFFLEKSARELSRKDLIVGLIVRLVAFSISAGIAFHFLSLIEIY
ncbi:MAG: hypothetical protein ACTSP4_09685 [Candidatus Hodarchaeales archaeon]